MTDPPFKKEQTLLAKKRGFKKTNSFLTDIPVAGCSYSSYGQNIIMLVSNSNVIPFKVLFAGTSPFAIPSLKALQLSHHSLCAVLTQPDKPQGRGQKMGFSVVKQLALDHHLKIYQPTSLKEATIQQQLRDLNVDVMVVIAYGFLLPPSILQIPRYGCLNVHASLLPRWRGAAPIQRAIESGDTETGVSIIQMIEELDQGPILRQIKTLITPEDTSQSLHDRLAKMGSELLLEALSELREGRFTRTPQNENLATYAPKIEKTEGLIDWELPARKLERKIRAFNPWPVAYSHLGNTTVRMWQAKVLTRPASKPAGTIIEVSREGIGVATGEEILQLTHLQLPGKRVLPVLDILNARDHPFKIGAVFHSHLAPKPSPASG